MNRLTEIGQQLKAAREARNRTLEDIALETHLKINHLQAIEAGDESKLPEPVYVKSFIRKYAQTVGLPADELANRYWETRPLPPTPPPSREFALPWWIPLWIIAALILVALVYAWVLSSRNPAPQPSPAVILPSATPLPTAAPVASASERAVPPPVASPSIVGGPAPASGSPAAPKPSEHPAAQPSPGPTRKPTPKPTHRPTPKPTHRPTPRPTAHPTPSPLGQEETPAPVESPASTSLRTAPKQARATLLLKLHATEAAWVRIVHHGREVFSATMGAGQTRAWPVGDELSVTIGNAAGVRVTLGARSLGALGTKGQVIKRVFKGDKP